MSGPGYPGGVVFGEVPRGFESVLPVAAEGRALPRFHRCGGAPLS